MPRHRYQDILGDQSDGENQVIGLVLNYLAIACHATGIKTSWVTNPAAKTKSLSMTLAN